MSGLTTIVGDGQMGLSAYSSPNMVARCGLPPSSTSTRHRAASPRLPTLELEAVVADAPGALAGAETLVNAIPTQAHPSGLPARAPYLKAGVHRERRQGIEAPAPASVGDPRRGFAAEQRRRDRGSLRPDDRGGATRRMPTMVAA
ncbi:MAG: hypothetical protein U0575_16980 [Phycisphaerales bacterium]